MADITLETLDIKDSEIKELLDDPVQKFLKDATIRAMINRDYNLIAYQIEITADNAENVKDAIRAMAVYECFVSYGQSISNTLQLQDISAYRANVENLKTIADRYAALIGIDMNMETTQPLGDPIAIIRVGGSINDVDIE